MSTRGAQTGNIFCCVEELDSNNAAVLKKT